MAREDASGLAPAARAPDLQPGSCAAPIVGAAAKAAEKEVDRSEVPVHLP